jgi:hypothetical protein
MAIFIEIPISAATFHDLYASMIVIGGNCENKCNRSPQQGVFVSLSRLAP